MGAAARIIGKGNLVICPVCQREPLDTVCDPDMGGQALADLFPMFNFIQNALWESLSGIADVLQGRDQKL